jgi:hypothetical protein
MKKEAAQAILNFLARVDLKGNEALLFHDCVMELNKFLEDRQVKGDKKGEDKGKV